MVYLCHLPKLLMRFSAVQSASPKPWWGAGNTFGSAEYLCVRTLFYTDIDHINPEDKIERLVVWSLSLLSWLKAWTNKTCAIYD
jgi:hypothetical protein